MAASTSPSILVVGTFSKLPGLRQGDLRLGLHRVPDVVVAHLDLLLGAADGDGDVPPLLRLASVAPAGRDSVRARTRTQFSQHELMAPREWDSLMTHESHDHVLCLLSLLIQPPWI